MEANFRLKLENFPHQLEKLGFEEFSQPESRNCFFFFRLRKIPASNNHKSECERESAANKKKPAARRLRSCRNKLKQTNLQCPANYHPTHQS
jgi:hypothetical protein